MRRNPERLAWIVLLTSFAVCVALAISLPLTIRWWINAAYKGLTVASIVQQGTIQVTCSNDPVPIAITERMDDVCQGVESMAILTGNDLGLFIVRTPEASSSQPIAEVQVANNTQLKILRARAPRFSISSQPYTLIVRIESGRACFDTAGSTARPVLVQVNSPEALVQMSQTNLCVQVGPGQTHVRVYEGEALVIWYDKGEGITLAGPQSAVVPPPDEVFRALPPAQNLIIGGDFSLPLDLTWQAYSKDIEFEGESDGEIVAGASGDTTLVNFTRIGIGHAETGLTQDINHDVQGVRSLQLRMVLRVLEQDVPVCGTQGTECPVMVKIEYEDSQGNLRSWLQGFYASLDPNRVNPPFCTVCSPRADHLRVEPNTWYVYDSPDLISLLNQAGAPPARILSIALYASGHTYRSEVSHIELLAQE